MFWYGRVSALPTTLVFFSFCCAFASELFGPNSELVPRSLAGTSVTAALGGAVLVDSFFAIVQRSRSRTGSSLCRLHGYDEPGVSLSSDQNRVEAKLGSEVL